MTAVKAKPKTDGDDQPSTRPAARPTAVIRLPPPHKEQEIFTTWEEVFPHAQVAVFPCGTKTGKTFGSSLWLLTTALINPGFYCVWIAPTLYKCRIAYRYMKAMLPESEHFICADGALEIRLSNGSLIKFLHGQNAEVTVEGEAIDAFVIDESGKQKAQLWYSLLTTITQTEGKGIVTGTPRGRNWYYELWQKVLSGDPFFCGKSLRTVDSPYIKAARVAAAQRILPPALFQQYYLAMFVSASAVYGDLDNVWDEQLTETVHNKSFWIHPDEAERKKSVVVGFDIAKRLDWSAIIAVNAEGKTVGYMRFKGKPYKEQARILGRFCRLFGGPDNVLRFDRTGVGDAVAEEIAEVMDRVATKRIRDDGDEETDWIVQEVFFSNASKQEMVGSVAWAIENAWWRAPRIPRLEREFVDLEVSVTKTGMASYAAPEGDHDDVHWAAALAISGAYEGVRADGHLDMIEAALSGKLLTSDDDETEDESDGLEDLDDLFPEEEEDAEGDEALPEEVM